MSLRAYYPAEYEDRVEYDLCFDRKGCPGSGYSFPCSEKGVVNYDELEPAGKRSLDYVTEDAGALYELPYIRKHVYHFRTSASGVCECGERIYLPNDSNDCECGRCYNGFGQELIPNYSRADCVADGWAWDEEDY